MASITEAASNEAVEHLDALIVGAGISGIGVACYLNARLPGKRYAILEERAASGGTWDLFRYPGIRSDSDLHTYGYAFKPWLSEEAIADGPAILDYVRETADEHGVAPHIRYQQRVVSASWSSDEALWTVTVKPAEGAAYAITCSWLFIAAGYFSYDHGYTPHFDGVDRFQGDVVHPQAWPADLDYDGRRVVIIGSGATAVTLLPAMAERAAQVTMLQRSPSYIISLPRHDPLAKLFSRFVSAQRAYELTRRKNVWLQRNIYRLSRSHPNSSGAFCAGAWNRGCPTASTSTRTSRRLRPVGSAAVRGTRRRHVRRDLRGARGRRDRPHRDVHGARHPPALGQELEADVIVTATGLDLQAFGGIDVSVDGETRRRRGRGLSTRA